MVFCLIFHFVDRHYFSEHGKDLLQLIRSETSVRRRKIFGVSLLRVCLGKLQKRVDCTH